MILNEDKSELYVAVDAPERRVSRFVYCYDVETKGLKWKEEGVAGRSWKCCINPGIVAITKTDC